MNERILFVARQFFGIPYIWGGNSPLRGFDCSGFVCEVLRSVGVFDQDRTAQGILLTLKGKGWVPSKKAGAVLFFGKDLDTVRHTAISVGNGLMIEAGGGNQFNQDLQDAINKNAYVRIRPFRKDLLCGLMAP